MNDAATKKKGGLAGMSEGRSDLFNVDPRKLKIKEGWNSRDFNDPSNIEHVNDLAASIAAVGVKQPLTIFFDDGQAWVTDGECRLRATLQAIKDGSPIKTVPVRAEDRHTNEADRLANQFIRNTGKQFSPMELSNHFKRLLGLGWQPVEIHKKTGVSQARISQLLNLQTLPEPIKEMVTAGQVSASMAVASHKEHGTAAEQQLKQGLEVAKAEGNTRVMPRHVEAAVPGNSGGGAVNIRTALKELFEDCDFNDDDPSEVIVTIPMDKWKLLRQLVDF